MLAASFNVFENLKKNSPKMTTNSLPYFDIFGVIYFICFLSKKLAYIIRKV